MNFLKFIKIVTSGGLMKNTIKNCIIRQLERRGKNIQFTCWNVSYAVLKTNTDTHTGFMIGMCKLAVDLSARLIFPLVGQHTVSHMCPRKRRHQYNLFLSVIFTVFPWFFLLYYIPFKYFALFISKLWRQSFKFLYKPRHKEPAQPLQSLWET